MSSGDDKLISWNPSERKLSRRQLLERATILGLSVPAVTAWMESLGLTEAAGQGAGLKLQQGATVKVFSQPNPWADNFKRMAADWVKLTGVNVQYVQAPFENMLSKLTTTYVSGIYAFDVAFHDTIWMPIFAKRGFLKNLTPYLKDPVATPAGFDYPNDFQNVEISGNYKPGNGWHLPAGIWGLPLIAGWRPLYYRTDLLKKAGLVNPPKTMEELVMYARKMNAPSEQIYGYVLSGSRGRINFDEYSGFLWTYGGDYFDKTFHAAFNSPQGLQALNTLIALAKVSPPGSGNYFISDTWTEFLSGHVALAITWQDLSTVAVKPGSSVFGRFDATAAPSHNGVTRPLYDGIVAAVPAKAKYPREAYAYVAWLLAPQHAVKTVLDGSFIPRWSVYRDPRVVKIAPSAKDDLPEESLRNAKAVPLIPEWGEVDVTIAEFLHRAVFVGDLTPEQALSQASGAVNAIMHRAGYF
ncbi:MAG TPA: sugar ABC transporter substrate-binding protein [bacterium]|nr:sugar ABC transporter substrate-binding protein [bacterium]